MKTWDEYKEYINKTDLIAKEILDEAEKDVISIGSPYSTHLSATVPASGT